MAFITKFMEFFMSIVLLSLRIYLRVETCTKIFGTFVHLPVFANRFSRSPGGLHHASVLFSRRFVNQVTSLNINGELFSASYFRRIISIQTSICNGCENQGDHWKIVSSPS